jgi:hypothetical protein
MFVWQLRNNNASLNNDVFFSKCKSSGWEKETDSNDIPEKNINVDDTKENTDVEVSIYHL